MATLNAPSREFYIELPQVEKSEVLLTLAMPTYLIKQTQTHTVCFLNIL